MQILRTKGGVYYANSRYHERAALQGAGFRWSRNRKTWYTKNAKIAAKLIAHAHYTIRPQLEQVLAQHRTGLHESRATTADIDVPAPAGLAYLPYQLAGIQYCLDRPATLIADEMGLGKTVEAIGVINADPTVERVLVVCPASLRLNWRQELLKWLVRPLSVGIAVGKVWPRPEPHVVIINYDILTKHGDRLYEQHWDLLICDEIHFCKNPAARRSQAVWGGGRGKKRLAGLRARRRLFLTGTPVVNRPRELWPILKSIDPVKWGDWDKFAFRYCAPYKGRYGWNFDGASYLPELQEQMRRACMIRRLKADVLHDLPPKRRQVIEIPAGRAAQQIKRETAAWTAQAARMASLRQQVRLSKATDDKDVYRASVRALREGRIAAFSEIAQVRRETAVAKVPFVVEHIESCLDAGSDKIVLFCHHHEVTDAYMAAFGKQAVRLDGRDSMDARDAAVRRFQEDPDVRVFVGGIRAAGVGLTLTAAAHVVFAELDWQPGALSQAEDRCHRIGQQDSVLCQHLVLEGSIDARMIRTILEKQEIISLALDGGLSALPNAALQMLDDALA